jgi:molybdate transport system substrate-binding protein
MENHRRDRYRIYLLVVAIFALIFPGCTNRLEKSGPITLTVFAASSLSDAIEALAEGFQADHPDVEILRHYASSSQLAAQLIEGAQADIFASANEIQMDHVVSAGLVAGSPSNFANNWLTVIVPADNPAGIESPYDLAKPGISLVLAAPDTPIRVYSDQVIGMLGDESFQAAVYANLVSEEANVRQVAAKVALGEADAGIVYISDVTPDVANDILQISIPGIFNIIAVYPVASLDVGENVELANQFIGFMLSPEGQAILSEWGFGTVP